MMHARDHRIILILSALLLLGAGSVGALERAVEPGPVVRAAPAAPVPPDARALAAAAPSVPARVGGPEGLVIEVAPDGGSPGSPLYLTDILVEDHPGIQEGNPDMDCTASGDCYLVYEVANSNSIRLCRSTDGGETWAFMMSLGHLTLPLDDPSITVPEVAEDYAYIAYSHGDAIWVLRVDLVTLDIVTYNVHSSAWGDVWSPRLANDNHDFVSYFVYFICQSAADTSYPNFFAYSDDQGASWAGATYLGGSDFPGKPDITYGGGVLHAAWDERVGTGEYNIHTARSLYFGAAWEPVVDLTSVSANDCRSPRIGAIQDENQVVVVHSQDWTTDLDLNYAFSTDLGATWALQHPMATLVGVDETHPDIAVDQTLGRFHVAFWQEWDIRVRHAAYDAPTSWTAAETVNEANSASEFYSPPAVAVDLSTGVMGVAWSDFRPSATDYAMYFDKDVPPPVPAAGPAGLVLLMLGIGGLIVRRRR